MRKRSIFLIKFFLSSILIIFLLYKIGLEDIVSTISLIDLRYIPLVLSVILLSIVLGVINANILLKSAGYNVRFQNLLKYYIWSWSAGLMTPGKIGELGIGYFLKKEKIPLGEGTAIAVIDRILSFIVISIVALAGFYLYFTKETAFRVLLLLTTVMIISAFLLFTKSGRGLIKYLLRKRSVLFKGFSKLMSFYMKKRKMALLINIAITFLKVLFMALTSFTIFLSLGTYINFFDVLLISAAGIIAALIPVSISGLGIRESVAIYLFSQINIEPNITLSAYIIMNIINYGLAGLSFLFLKEKNIIIS